MVFPNLVSLSCQISFSMHQAWITTCNTSLPFPEIDTVIKTILGMTVWENCRVVAPIRPATLVKRWEVQRQNSLTVIYSFIIIIIFQTYLLYTEVGKTDCTLPALPQIFSFRQAT